MRIKPKLLYASPFWPMKSGISEYSAALVYGLENYFEITLLTDNYKIDSKRLSKDFQQEIYQQGKCYDEFDAIIYNIGNNPYYHMYMAEAMAYNPGFIILHDYVLYYLAIGIHQRIGDIFQSIYAQEGVRGIGIIKDSLKKKPEPNLLEHKSVSAKLPMNREILDMAKGVFVHSNYAKSLLYNLCPEKPCHKIELVKMHLGKTAMNCRQFANKRYSIPETAYVVGSLGFVGETKQNELCCKAIRAYNQMHNEKIYYLLVGEGEYINNYLDEFIIKTGFLESEDYLSAASRCDLVLNLRYPTNGETSAALIQSMDNEKPCVVTDTGWFGELPHDLVVKVQWDIKPEDLADIIHLLKTSDNTLMTQRAKTYVDTDCAPEKIALDIKGFIEKNSAVITG